MNSQIDKFIADRINVEYQPIFVKFRVLVHKKYPQLKEELRGGTEKYYGVPVYRNQRIVLTVSPTQKGITFSFADGKKMEDKFGLLEGAGNKTLNIRIACVEDYDDEVMKYYIDQAIKIDDQRY